MSETRNPFSPDNYPSRDAAYEAMHRKLEDSRLMQDCSRALRRSGYEKMANQMFFPAYTTWMMAFCDMCAASLLPVSPFPVDAPEEPNDDEDETDYPFVFPQRAL